MSPFDCDLDPDAPRRLPYDQYSSIELGKLFGCDEPEEPIKQNEGDGLRESANPSVTQKFCLPDRTTPLSPDEGAVLWERLRQNGYAPCSIRSGSKAPVGKAWQKQAFRDGSVWMASAPGIGLVCGGLDRGGEPAPVARSLIVLDLDFRLTNAIAVTGAPAKPRQRGDRTRRTCGRWLLTCARMRRCWWTRNRA